MSTPTSSRSISPSTASPSCWWCHTARLTAFVDPHVKFGLQFNVEASDDAVTTVAPANTEAATEADNTDDEAAPTAEVVTLDAFRRK